MKIHFISLGCKTNQYETNAMEQKFIKNGYEIANAKDETADVYVVNTCSVTNIAERKSRQMLRRAKEKNENTIVVACGCYAQVAKEEISKIPEVDLILGINEKNNIVEIVEKYIEEYKNNTKDKSLKTKKEQVIEVTDVMHQNEYKDFGETTYTEENRAVIKIQDGCDRFCSYCIIPYARGKVRSRNPENVIREIKKIADEGVKEIVLTGIHIASYGKDFSEEQVEEFRKIYKYETKYTPYNAKEDLSTGGFRLIELLEQINKVDKIERIRIGSIEPKLITTEFVERLKNINKLCDHFHLSLQSGCNETLKKMNRRYTTEDFEKSCNLLRKTFPNVALTTDIIVGFPGETDENFEETYKFLEGIKFYKMHIFKYSPKKGTVAEKMENQIDGNVKEKRSQRLIELSNKNEEEYNKSYIGKEVKVLFEEPDSKGFYQGHTSNYMIVKVKSDKILKNEIRTVKITETNGIDTIGLLK